MIRSVSVFFAAFLCLAAMGLGAVEIDGKITQGEYPGAASFANGLFNVHWKIEGADIAIAIDAESPGWVSIGFDPRSVMDKADMVFGVVPAEGDSTPVQALDTFCDGMFGPHPLDEKAGGKSDIKAFAGSRAGGRVIFEFTRALDTGDSRDKVIPATGELKIIWAIGSAHDFESEHLRAGSGVMDIAAGSGHRASGGGKFVLLAHIGLLSLSFGGMFVGMVIARYYKKKKFWLKLHKPLGVASAASGILGVITAAILVQTTGGPHLRVLHGVLGLCAIIACAAMPAIGFGIFRYKGDKKKIKAFHRVAGRVTILLMAGVIISGLITSGIIRLR